MKARIIGVIAIVVLCIVGSIAFVVQQRAQHNHDVATAPRPASAALTTIEAQPRIVFRNTSMSDYGRVAMVSLADPSGARAFSGTVCDRVYATAVKVICLSSKAGVVTTYAARILDNSFTTERDIPLSGSPSRARLSKDGSLSATTSFTSGDSYLQTGFSTRTVITDLTSGTSTDLESFRLVRDGTTIDPTDRNFWGVTFAGDDNRFYATVAFAKHTYLVQGDRMARTLTILHEDAECPSLSPDGTRIVYKKRSGQPAGKWRLAEYDIATGKETWLAETRSVDDQVEWLNDTTVIYGLARTGSQAASDDVFAVPADGTGTPTLLIENAWSPAVVR